MSISVYNRKGLDVGFINNDMLVVLPVLLKNSSPEEARDYLKLYADIMIRKSAKEVTRAKVNEIINKTSTDMSSLINLENVIINEIGE